MSIGGGAITIKELDGFALQLTGENPSMLILHKDAYGTVANVTKVLMEHKINIGHMEVSRLEKGHTALMVIETDQPVSENIINEISSSENVRRIIILDV